MMNKNNINVYKHIKQEYINRNDKPLKEMI